MVDRLDEMFRFQTEALKLRSQFVPVFFVRTQDLRLEKYAYSKKSLVTINLGSFDPGRQTLIYGVFVGNRGQSFPTLLSPDLKFRVLDFGAFRFCITWSLLTLPSDSTACLAQYSTRVPAGVSEDQMGAALRRVEGLNADGCLYVFRAHRDALVKSYEDLLNADVPTPKSS